MRKLVLILVILLVASCGPKLEEQVIGEWERVDGELWPAVVNLELDPEGEATVTILDGQSMEERPYEWSIEGGDFCANWDDPLPICYQMELEGENLTLFDVRGNSVTLARVD